MALRGFIDARIAHGLYEAPSVRDFRAADLRGLYDAVEQRFGNRAAMLSVGLDPRPCGRDRAWTEDRIATALRIFLARRAEQGMRQWPSVAEFKAAGLGGMHRAMRRYGQDGLPGVAFWAQRFGMSTRWTETRLELELRAFADGRGTWPSQKAFREAGRGDLREAARKHGGERYWAGRLELVYPRYTRWSEAVIHEALLGLFAGRTSCPSGRAFKAAGLAGLHLKLRREGTMEHWAARLSEDRGVRRNEPDRSASPIEAALR